MALHAMSVVPGLLAAALILGGLVLLGYAYNWAAIAVEWAAWQTELSRVALCAWAFNALLCVPAYGTVAAYAVAYDSVFVAVLLVLFTASACTWVWTLGWPRLAAASVLSTGVLSVGFTAIYFEAPENPAYWVAPAVLVLQHVAYDAGWWLDDYSSRPQRPKPSVLLLLERA